MTAPHTGGIRNFPHTHGRPPLSERLFVSDYLDAALAVAATEIGDPVLRKMFSQCLPDTLDTTVYTADDENGHGETVVVTGDIPAMWLRDSTNQVWPYLRYIRHDHRLREMVRGLLRRQTRCLKEDVYANAFELDCSVWERKFEVDSWAAFMRLSRGYFGQTGDLTPFDRLWVEVVRSILEAIRREQNTLNKDTAPSLFRFVTKSGHAHPAVRLHGYGYPGRRTGMVRTMFRPSDDEAVFPYNIPVNAMLSVEIRNSLPLMAAIGEERLANSFRQIAEEIDRGIACFGTTNHPEFGTVYAYESDGFGSVLVMDDPNVPSLISLPYLEWIGADDPVYRRTRHLVLSEWNSFYAYGTVASGQTSPHVGVTDKFWPMATIMQAMTSDDAEEIRACLGVLRKTHAGTYFIHESVDVDDPRKYTRHWFSWANSLFGELILRLLTSYPETLRGPYR